MGQHILKPQGRALESRRDAGVRHTSIRDWLWIAAMNPKRADQGDPCLRSIYNLWLGLVAIIITVLTQTAAQAQTAASTDRIKIDYGFVTQHYQTSWSDPRLPAGIARGMPPSFLGSISENKGESSMSDDDANDADLTETGDDMSEAAVLYAIDLEKDGMTMVVSTKSSLQPGDCAAIERWGTYFNLRGVNAGFCDPANQATILSLQSVNVAAAHRCKLAREKLEVRTFEDNQALTSSEIGMLCDGN